MVSSPANSRRLSVSRGVTARPVGSAPSGNARPAHRKQALVMESIISKLHLKFAEKTWNETFQLVRRCMDKPKDKSKPCTPLVRSLERLQEVVNVSSMSTMRSRLEVIAKQQGMGFHVTEATCYLTGDLFYLEVVLLPCGGAEEVKVAPHGGPPAPSESFLRLLRAKLFVEFSAKLADLFAQYNIPGDNEMQLKLFASLQFLEKDLQQISQLPSVPTDSDPRVDLINNGRMGYLIPGKEDCPLTIQFYTTPPDEMTTSDIHMAAPEALVQAAQVAVGVSEVTRELQTASVLPQPPQLDPHGRPVFLPPSEAPHETLPACFLLKLKPAVPMTSSFLSKLSPITDVAIPDVDLQWAPLPKLLMGRSPSSDGPGEPRDEQDHIFTVPLPGGVMHRYVLAGAAWGGPAQRATAVHSIPFTHPAHVPALLALLRHQCAINALLRSCIASRCDGAGLVCDLHSEVLPESETSFSVTFPRPDADDSLAVLLVNVLDSNRITCTLFGSEAGGASTEEYLSTVMKRSMSVPAALEALRGKLEEIPVSAPPSPGRPATAEAENDHAAPSSPSVTAVTDGDAAVTGAATTATTTTAMEISQSAAAPEEGVAVTAPAAESELPPEIHPDPPAPVEVFTPEVQ